MTDLSTRRLGNSQIKITPVGLGTAPIGSTPEWKVYWGPQDESAAVRAIQTAIDLGVNWIDTAPFYGWGRAERIVGKAWGTLAHGFLTDGFSLQQLDANDFRHQHPYAQGARAQQIQRLHGALGAIARVHGKTVAAAAVAWVLMQPALTGAIIGVRNAQEARAMTDGVGWKLSREELQTIDDALAG